MNSSLKTSKSILLSLVVVIISVNLVSATPKRVLIEYITGTWCGNCPCGHQTLNTIKTMYPQTIIIAYHAFSNDPWRNFNGNEIVSLMQFSATPSANIDRNNPLNNGNYGAWISGVQERYVALPDARVDLNIVSKSYNETSRELNMTINSTAMVNLTGQYKITYVITEDNLIYQQNFYSNCGPPGYVQNYNHGNVARNIINGAGGENLNTGNVWNANESVTRNVSVILDPSWDASNCKITAFVNRSESSFPLSMIEQAVEASVTGTVGITGSSAENPYTYVLSQNYPNPFNPTTKLEFGISKLEFVSLKIYDILGIEIVILVNENKPAGNHSVSFDGSNLPSGIYFYALNAGRFSDRKMMTLLK